MGGSNPITITENFNGLGDVAGPRNGQSNNLIDLSALPPNNPPAKRFLGRFDNTFNDSNAPINVPWAEVEEGTNASNVSGRYGVSVGDTAVGNTYSFASAAAPSDRALGSLTNDVVLRNLLGACFINTTGGAISVVYLKYAGEQWRAGGGGFGGDRLEFQLAVDTNPQAADNIFTANGGAFTDFNALDFAAPQPAAAMGALDGNANANRLVFPATALNVTIPANAVLYVRWVDNKLGTGGNDDALAIDDFQISLAAPTAAAVAVGGRVVTADGRGIGKARLALTAINSAEERIVQTNPFGYYFFRDVAVGEYLIRVSSKNYVFENRAPLLVVAESLDELNFVAAPRP